MRSDFGYIDEYVAGIRWDAKYATWDNFTGKPVDGYLANRLVGTTALCEALRRAQRAAEDVGYGLLIWDAYRPQRAVDRFQEWAQEPEDGAKKAVHYPRITRAQMFEEGYVATRSGHSRGSTVDLTLFHLMTGALAEMGGPHDLMDPISHHGAAGLEVVAAHHRELLRSVMEHSGFLAYEREWWHYTLRDEPYPDTYFDFPIAGTLRA